METSNRCTLICCLGADLVDRGASLGPRSLANCRKTARLVQEMRKDGENPIVILSPGRANREGLSSSYPKQVASMAEMMRMSLNGLGVRLEDIRIPQEVWGTKAELVVLKSVTQHLRSCRVSVERIMIITSWWHVYRTRMNASALGLDNFEIHGAEDSISPRDCVEEIIKICVEWIRIRVPVVGTALKAARGRD